MSGITLAALHRALPADLVAFPDGADIAATPITGVHISELADPSRYLEGGELLLTTGLTVVPSAGWFRDYFERLRRARITGLALGLGPRFHEVPDGFAAAVPEAGFALFVVPERTRFLTITRRYWEMSAVPRRRAVAQVLAGHRALLDAAAQPDPEHTLVRRLATAVGGWAAHLSHDGALVSVHPASARGRAQELRADIARIAVAGTRAAASMPVGDQVAELHPLAARTAGSAAVAGYLAVGSAGPLSAEQRDLVLAGVAVLSAEVGHRRRLHAAELGARTPVLQLLCSGRTDAAELLADLVLPLWRTGTHRPAVVVGPSGTLAELSDQACADDRCLIAWTDSQSLRLLLSDMPGTAAWLASIVREASAAGALGPPVEFSALAKAYLRIGRRAETAGPGTIVEVGPTAGSVLDQLDASTRAAWATARLDAVLTYDRVDLVPALVAYLQHGGNWEAAGRELASHRHTVRHQVRRAAELLRVDITDADVRAELWLALRALALA
jgi:PucR family transcriptional regulator, purine catabolism regulatory protein